jgi:di/tricarboxylate transporter
MAIVIVLGLLVLAIAMFALEVVSVDLVTLLLVAALVLTGILTPGEAFGGFSSEIIIIIASIFVLTGALQQTGVVEAVGARLERFAGRSRRAAGLLLMSLVGGLSAFMNNTTATALFVSPAIGLARRARISPSKLLMPMAYASILGGTCTLIGTSTNVAVSGYLARQGIEPIGLFELTPVGLLVVAIGILYMLLAGHRLLPDHKDESLTEEFAIREYLSEIIVVNDSHLIGQRIFESDLARMDFQILSLVRANRRLTPARDTVIAAGDVLLVKARAEELMKVKAAAGIEIRPELHLDDPALQSDDTKIAEALVKPMSELIGRTLTDVHFRQRFGLTVLAINRHGTPLRERLGRIKLRLGDLLLVQGPRESLEQLRRNPDLTILEELSPALYRRKRGLFVAGCFGAAVVAGGFGLMPLSVAFLLAAVAVVLARVLSPEEAYDSVDWRLLILIGGMTAFGAAMDKTGAAELLAKGLVDLLGPLGPRGLLAGFFVLTIVLTQPMSNAAAALVVLPVALESAEQLGVSPRPFAIGVMLAASLSFITPLEPSCILVYGPGKYRFRDFVKVGAGLTLILATAVLYLVPIFWPMAPTP